MYLCLSLYLNNRCQWSPSPMTWLGWLTMKIPLPRDEATGLTIQAPAKYSLFQLKFFKKNSPSSFGKAKFCPAVKYFLVRFFQRKDLPLSKSLNPCPDLHPSGSNQKWPPGQAQSLHLPTFLNYTDIIFVQFLNKHFLLKFCK